MAKIWMQGKERFMCPVCKNEEIELGQKYCQICGEALKWGGGQARMERLTIPDKKIPGGTRRALINVRAVREEAVTIYWALKKYEDTGLSPEEIRALKANEKHRWIPVEERLPEDDNYILLSFSNLTLPLIGSYEAGSDGGGAFYLGGCDEGVTCLSNNLFVNAWMPLPEPYRKEKNSNE